MVTNFADVSPSLMYDVLHDADYRRCWDDNMLECFEICQLDRYNDIGYYSSKSIHFCSDMPSSFYRSRGPGSSPVSVIVFHSWARHLTPTLNSRCILALASLFGLPGKMLRYYLRLTSILSRGWAENNIDTSYYWHFKSSWYLMVLKQTSSI